MGRQSQETLRKERGKGLARDLRQTQREGELKRHTETEMGGKHRVEKEAGRGCAVTAGRVEVGDSQPGLIEDLIQKAHLHPF